MASDKERREVAATMRAISGRGVKDLTLGEVLNSILTGGAPRPTTEMAILANLADLIDRSTCEDVGDFDHEAFKCSRCGYRVLSLRGIANGSPSDAVLVTPDGLITEFAYCPNCGAEVTDGD